MNSKFKIQNSKLPFVLVNMAMTADGKIATANRAVSSFGSAHDHDHLLELRATADAVMAGARTVDLNAINLGPGPKKFRRLRLKRGLAEYNLRIIISGSGSINPRAEIFKHRLAKTSNPLARTAATLSMNQPTLDPSQEGSRTEDARLQFPAWEGSGAGSGEQFANARSVALGKSPIIILITERASASARRRLRALADEVKICGRRKINFHAALRWLRAEWGVTRLLCEGGGELNDALFRAGLVDELHLTVCPKIFGGRHAPTIAEGTGFLKLAAAARLKLKSVRRLGDEMFLVYAFSPPRIPSPHRMGRRWRKPDEVFLEGSPS